MNSNKKHSHFKNKLDIEKINLLLGEMGFLILESIKNGAKNLVTIKMLSGVSMECIVGRLPVLIKLKLVSFQKMDVNTLEYSITKRGSNFLEQYD